MSVKTLLALDFSTSFRTVALMEIGTRKLLACSSKFTAPVPTSTAEAEGIHFIINKLLNNAGLTQENVQVLSLGIGPGSYNGVRSTIALAQGWSLSADIKLAAVSTLDALSFQANRLGWIGRHHILVDAQRDEYYHAVYQAADVYTLPSALEPVQILPKESLLPLFKENENVGGPDLSESFPGIYPLYPLAEDIGLISLLQNNFIQPENLSPIYLRPTQFAKAKPYRPLPI